MPLSKNATSAALLCSILILVASSASQVGISATHADLIRRLVAAAVDRTHHTVRYDPAYVGIPYPNGDVPADTGVCTDEIIRSYRAVGIDLQKEVHEDMAQNFSAYPRKWRWLSRKTDPNIDHRRVPNLMVFFARKGEILPISSKAKDYKPGDLVTWDLSGNVPHIGIIVDRKAANGHYLIVHNIGRGPQMEDVLFSWKVTGHFRYYGPRALAESWASRPTGRAEPPVPPLLAS